MAACAAVVLAGCSTGENSTVPEILADGRPAVELAVELDEVDAPVILTAVEVVEAGRAPQESDIGACLASRPERVARRSPVVARVTTRSASVTARVRSEPALVACDGVPEPGRTDEVDWCGSSYGALFDGRLRDPRLDIGCATEDGAPLGHLWIEPDPRAAFVSVEQDGYVEAYEVAAGLPVRVMTANVELEASRAGVDVWEHDRAGELVRRYRRQAAVAG